METIVPVQGKNLILAARNLKDEKTASGLKLALQVEHSLKLENNVETKSTKDGSVPISATTKYTMDVKGLLSNNPTNAMLKEAVKNGDTVEFWEIDISAPTATGTNKYKAQYFRAKLKSWENPAPSEGFVEFSTQAEIEGIPQVGEVTLSAEQVAQVNYAFRDLTPVV